MDLTLSWILKLSSLLGYYMLGDDCGHCVESSLAALSPSWCLFSCMSC